MKNLKAIKKEKNKIVIDYTELKEYNFDFDVNILNKLLVKAVLKNQDIHYDVSVNVYVVNNAEIKKINYRERVIDKVTDVLSFPNISFLHPCGFSYFIKNGIFDVSIINVLNKTVFLGDIVINYDRVIEQSKEYGHSMKREYAFLFVHSMLHLLGYDHTVLKDERKMFKYQDAILDSVNIKR